MNYLGAVFPDITMQNGSNYEIANLKTGNIVASNNLKNLEKQVRRMFINWLKSILKSGKDPFSVDVSTSPDMQESQHSILQKGEIEIPDDIKSQIETFKMPIGYPPKIEGYPARISGKQLLIKTQAEMITKIKREMQIGELFDELVMPLLCNTADFIHLLPASEAHHHRAQGGFLRHSLEVCYIAVKHTKTTDFDSNETPEERSANALKWRLAVAVTALLHDIGKPVSDYEIWDQTGVYQWKPSGKNLFHWAVEHDIERYFLQWNKKRHNNHRIIAPSLIEKIVPAKVIELLQQNSKNLYFKVIEAISNSDNMELADKKTINGNQLFNILLLADRASVANDLKLTSGDAIRAAGSGVSTIQRLVDTMRQFISSGRWTPNVPPSPIWSTPDGVYIIWASAAEELCKEIKNLGIFIPQSADSLGEILLAHDVIIEAPRGSLYWKIAPKKLLKSASFIKDPDTFFYCVKLASDELLFGENIKPTHASVYVKNETSWVSFEPKTGTNVEITGEKTEPTIVNNDFKHQPIDIVDKIINDTPPESDNVTSIMETLEELAIIEPVCNEQAVEVPEVQVIAACDLKIQGGDTLPVGNPASEITHKHSLGLKERIIAMSKPSVALPMKSLTDIPVATQLSEQKSLFADVKLDDTDSVEITTQKGMHSDIYITADLHIREAFEIYLLGLSKKQLISNINQNHLLVDDKLEIPSAWKARSPQASRSKDDEALVLLRSNFYLVLKKELLIDVFIITGFSEIEQMLNPVIPDLATSLIEDVIFSIHNENDISENQFKTIQYIELSRTELIEISAKLGVSQTTFKQIMAVRFESYNSHFGLQFMREKQ
ncbi:MobH family relaxase [Klebsiella pneumoniae]|uniref:MobH family relaxase n=1 Tax=Klebsiella pneumoniae TaxID=573 RepID=UPI00224759DC|nr:MobH family relaxase [Klebsiella pneumoniae]MCW9243077.1 TraI domain-containing protein [Klebsiella pneumoniae]